MLRASKSPRNERFQSRVNYKQTGSDWPPPCDRSSRNTAISRRASNIPQRWIKDSPRQSPIPQIDASRQKRSSVAFQDEGHGKSKDRLTMTFYCALRQFRRRSCADPWMEVLSGGCQSEGCPTHFTQPFLSAFSAKVNPQHLAKQSNLEADRQFPLRTDPWQLFLRAIRRKRSIPRRSRYPGTATHDHLRRVRRAISAGNQTQSSATKSRHNLAVDRTARCCRAC
jgi:hypothetical protein